MDSRRLIMALAASMLVFIGWMFISPLVMPPPRVSTTATQPSSQPTTTQDQRLAAVPETTSRPTAVASQPAVTAAPARPVSPRPAPDRPDGKVRLTTVVEASRRVQLGSDDPEGPFKLMLAVNSRGASVDDVDLTPLLPRYRNFPKGDHRADLDKDVDPFDSYDLLRPVEDKDNHRVHRSLSTEEVNILIGGASSAPGEPRTRESTEDETEAGLWQALDLTDKHWAIERRIEDGRETAVCTLTIQADGKPILRLVKTYVLTEGTYDVDMSLRVESLDERPHQVILTQRGPINIHSFNLRGDSRKIYHAMRVGEAIKTGTTQRKDTVVKEKDDQGREKIGLNAVLLPPPDSGGSFLWAALGNQYFATIVTPVNAEGKADSSALQETQVVHLTGNQGTDENGDLTFRFISRAAEVKAKEPLELRFNMYIGPKERSLFSDAEGHPTYVARDYMGTIQEEYYFCVWAPLAELMTKLLIGLHRWVWPHNWGLAIIILVLVVRVILHPVTKKGQVSMSRMQTQMAELQPKLEELKRKHSGDRNKLNQETMALYREHNINPGSNMLGCLPMMLQMPIWVALWATLSNTIELRHASFMIIPNRWILDLAAPDALVRFKQPVSLLFFQMDALNILPFLWGISMVLQQKLTPRPKSGKTTEQMQQQQKMMYIMAVVFTVMFYSFPSGLTLYIMASNFFGLIEQWRIRQHLEAEQRDKPATAAATAGGAKPAVKAAAPPSEPSGVKAWLLSKLKPLSENVDKIRKFDDQQRRSVKRNKKR